MHSLVWADVYTETDEQMIWQPKPFFILIMFFMGGKQYKWELDHITPESIGLQLYVFVDFFFLNKMRDIIAERRDHLYFSGPVPISTFCSFKNIVV